MSIYLWIFIGGGIGSILRYLCSIYFHNNATVGWPIGTLLANFLSCFILGILLALKLRESLSQSIILLMMVGLCGGFSTFSTFSLELLQMLQTGSLLKSFTYMTFSIVVGVGLVFLGFRLMSI